MNKKYNYTIPLLTAIVAVFGILVGMRFQTPRLSLTGTNSKTLDEVLNIIQNEYVDTLNNEKITRSAIEGALKELDPHSVFIPSEDVKAANEDLEGNFEGVGIEFN